MFVWSWCVSRAGNFSLYSSEKCFRIELYDACKLVFRENRGKSVHARFSSEPRPYQQLMGLSLERVTLSNVHRSGPFDVNKTLCSFNLACACHAIGSTGKSCDNQSGQCTCKEGVSGLTCNRCARGYVQSRSHVAPCISKLTSWSSWNIIPDFLAREEDLIDFFHFPEPRVMMNMPQNTAPEPYYSDQTDVKPKSRDGKRHQFPSSNRRMIFHIKSLSLRK